MNPPSLVRTPRGRWLLAGAAGVVALGLLRVWAPGDSVDGATCVTRRVLGLACPTCGMTRAFSALAHGDWSRALALHPLAPLVAAELAAAWLLWGVAVRRGAWPLPRRLTIGALVLTGALFAGVWLARLATHALPT
jgi:hypothetical protein